MPEGLLEYFQILEVDQVDNQLHIYLDELNIAPTGYQNSKLESKGFMPSTEISDFPIRGQKVTLHIRRRRWTVWIPERSSQEIGIWCVRVLE
ncbi:hypothetical protein AACH28_04155 [Sphingobacterium thalpophilum]|uniref:Uncharacterized protein n=1 Tax=Sphingobacterium thalpophilum TaxID=259 RepID=A0ACD5C4B8_9SPHI